MLYWHKPVACTDFNENTITQMHCVWNICHGFMVSISMMMQNTKEKPWSHDNITAGLHSAQLTSKTVPLRYTGQLQNHLHISYLLSHVFPFFKMKNSFNCSLNCSAWNNSDCYHEANWRIGKVGKHFLNHYQNEATRWKKNTRLAQC